MRTLAPFAFALLATGCAPPSVTDQLATIVFTTPIPSGSGFGYDARMRANGVYLTPRSQVAIAAVHENPVPGRRILVAFVDVDSASTRYGDVVEVDTPYSAGSTSMRGLTATSFRDTDGSVDGLLLAVDDTPPQVIATTIDGSPTRGGIEDPLPITGIESLNPSAIPGVESGTSTGQNRIMMAYVGEPRSAPTIRVGTLTQISAGAWDFEERSSVSTCEPDETSCTCVPEYELAIAYDPTRSEFAVGWECGAISAYIRRFNFDGMPVGPVFLAHDGASDGTIHSGVTLSYNRVVDRYFFTMQHNSALLTPAAGGSLTCVPNPPTACASVLPTICHDRGAQWAAGVDYSSGFEFRVGSSAQADGAGLSYQLAEGTSGEVCQPGAVLPQNWFLGDELWPARLRSFMHEYVRAPADGVTVAIHTNIPNPLNDIGELRYSFIDEPGSPPFDE